jgi:hypothetical protein
MRVGFVRRGGFVGVPLRGEADTANLHGLAAAKAERALQGLPFGRPPAVPRHPDSFQYQITILDTDEHPSVVLDEAQLPDDLRPLLDKALAEGDLG